jgi:hypothetical protein
MGLGEHTVGGIKGAGVKQAVHEVCILKAVSTGIEYCLLANFEKYLVQVFTILINIPLTNDDHG